MQTKRVSQGIAEYERSLTLDPNLAESRALIGLAKIFDGHAEETERDENEALRLSPRDKSAWAWMHFSGSAKLYLGADRKYQRLAAGCVELELLSQPPRGSINSLEQVRNSMLMLNRTIVFPRDLQRRQ